MLAFALEEREDELRADLQEVYGVDLDHAAGGEHTAAHVASLVSQLPHTSRLFASVDPDAVWSLDSTLLAATLNALNGLVYMMSDKKRRGNPPSRVGPSWMVQGPMRRLEAGTMTVDGLVAELSGKRV